MKLVLITILAVLAVSANAIDPDEADKKFREYLDEFKIRIQRSGLRYEEKKQNFLNTLKMVEENNQNKSTGYELEINELAHLSFDEFVRTKTGEIPPPDDLVIEAYNYSSRGARASLPAAWDWRNRYGVVRPVQNQGGCGSCWVFGGIGAIEGQMSLKYGNHEKISEQEALECIKKSAAGIGCAGGWSQEVFSWAASVGGVASASRRPYKAVDYTPCQTSLNPRSRGSKTTGRYVSITNLNEEAMKEALVNVGPLKVSIFATGEFSSYKSGVYSDAKNQCLGAQSTNHAVVLVGYGTENGQNYWVIRNSWGPGWGDKGYIKMARGRNLCNVARSPMYPILA